MCAEEGGGGTLELMPGGKDMEVTSGNVYDYVRKYAKYRMVKAQEKAMEVRDERMTTCINVNISDLRFRVYAPVFLTFFPKDHWTG